MELNFTLKEILDFCASQGKDGYNVGWGFIFSVRFRDDINREEIEKIEEYFRSKYIRSF